MLARHENFHDAIEVYQRFIDRIETHERFHWNLYYRQGIAYERTKQWPKAEVAFLKALELYPNQPSVLNYLGFLIALQAVIGPSKAVDHVAVVRLQIDRFADHIEAFLQLDLDGQKVVVGTGPMLEELRQRYPDVIFTNAFTREDLAEAYASADVFVFPSLTDTFGIVLIEAMASGVPVAAYPVTGPIDNVQSGVTGILDDDLASAARRAMQLDRGAVRAHGQSFSWENAGRLFMSNIETALFSKQGKRVPARSKRRLLRRTRPVSEL